MTTDYGQWGHNEEDDMTPEQDARLGTVEKYVREIAVSTVPHHQDARPADGRFQVQTLVRRAVAPMIAGIADVDEAELAAALAPLLVMQTRALSDADLDAIATAVNDEQHRRSAG